MSKFTLIELLVLIAIIGILSSLLLPSLTNAKATSQASLCVNNLKQSGMAIFMYAEDNENALMTNMLNATLSSKRYITNAGSAVQIFNGGSIGYAELYLTNSDSVYNCPASTHEDGYGTENSHWTHHQGVYNNIISPFNSTRTFTENTITGNPDLDAVLGWDLFSRKPILHDPIYDVSPSTGSWNGSAWYTTNSKIHENNGNKVPILMDNNSIVFGDLTPYGNRIHWWLETVIPFINSLC